MGLVQGFGVYEVGESLSWVNGKHTKEYELWGDILRRSYSINWHNRNPTYRGCSVSKEWLSFQDFAKWFNSYEYYKPGYQLDKDLIIKGNKVYSSATCVFVPGHLNKLLTNRRRARGACPVGVCYHKRDKMFSANISIKGKKKHIGYYPTLEQAYAAYKDAKEDHIKTLAEEYKTQIDPRAYAALMKYEIHEHD